MITNKSVSQIIFVKINPKRIIQKCQFLKSMFSYTLYLAGAINYYISAMWSGGSQPVALLSCY